MSVVTINKRNCFGLDGGNFGFHRVCISRLPYLYNPPLLPDFPGSSHMLMSSNQYLTQGVCSESINDYHSVLVTILLSSPKQHPDGSFLAIE